MSENDGKEPQSAAEFFKGAIESLENTFGLNKARLEKEGIRRIAELQEKVARGDRARALVDMDVWKKDIVPHFEQGASKAMKPWRPGESLDAVDPTYFHASGYANAFLDLITKLRGWSEEGVAAARELAFEQEQRKKARERATR
jgi:hypothetical protein